MEFKELLSEAIGALTLNKTRTALATLGIVIGIGSVIALVSLGQAGQKQVETQIQSLGSNLLTVSPGAPQSGGVRGAAGGLNTLTYEDAKAIASSPVITAVTNVSPEYTRRAQITAGRNNTNTQIVGATDVYSQVRNGSISEGSFITKRDVESMAKVAVLGPQAVNDLFGNGANPVGSTIRINKIAFRVVGVTVSKGGSGFFNQDDIAYIPLTTAQQQVFGSNFVSSISIEAKSSAQMTDAENQVGYLLLSRHRISDPTLADFQILSQSDILSAASQVTSTFSALLSGIAAISLLVGGIGIMNIMLVTVTERTREIGLRKALGAKKNTVVMQFLAESIMLTFAGGAFGMIIGAVLSFTITKLINLPFVLSLSSVVLAIVVSGAIGIIFGWYPARKAASLSPIEALRYE